MNFRRQRVLKLSGFGPRGAWSLSDVSMHILTHNNCPPGQGFSSDFLELGWDSLWRFLSASGVGPNFEPPS